MACHACFLLFVTPDMFNIGCTCLHWHPIATLQSHTHAAAGDDDDDDAEAAVCALQVLAC